MAEVWRRSERSFCITGDFGDHFVVLMTTLHPLPLIGSPGLCTVYVLKPVVLAVLILHNMHTNPFPHAKYTGLTTKDETAWRTTKK